MIYLISASMCLVEKLIKMDPVFEELLSVLILQGFLFMQKIMLEKQPRPGTVITLKNHGSHGTISQELRDSAKFTHTQLRRFKWLLKRWERRFVYCGITRRMDASLCGLS